MKMTLNLLRVKGKAELRPLKGQGGEITIKNGLFVDNSKEVKILTRLYYVGEILDCVNADIFKGHSEVLCTDEACKLIIANSLLKNIVLDEKITDEWLQLSYRIINPPSDKSYYDAPSDKKIISIKDLEVE